MKYGGHKMPLARAFLNGAVDSAVSAIVFSNPSGAYSVLRRILKKARNFSQNWFASWLSNKRRLVDSPTNNDYANLENAAA